MRKLAAEPPSSEITPESLYRGRREFIKNGALTLGTALAVGSGLLALVGGAPPPDAPPEQPVAEVPGAQSAASAAQPVAGAATPTPKGPYDTDEPITSFQSITTYNNFYEFGTDKGDPARNAH